MKVIVSTALVLFCVNINTAQCTLNVIVWDASPCIECSGIAAASLQGFSTPVSFLWSNGVTTHFNQTLCPGENWLTVTDINGCTATDDFTVNVATVEPVEMELTSDINPDNLETYCISGIVTGGSCDVVYRYWEHDMNMSPVYNCNFQPNTTYTLVVQDNCGCYYNFSVTTGPAQSAGFDTLNENKIVLFPNPSLTSELHIWSIENTAIEIEFLNLAGQTLMQVSLDDTAKSIDISNLDSGFYVCRIMYGNQVIVRNFVKL